MMTYRAEKRAKALAKQIYDAGHLVPCNCGLSGCFYRATPKARAERIIQGQTKTLKLNQQMIDFVLSRVQLC